MPADFHYTYTSSRVAAVIPAGGVGKRMGLGSPKQFAELAGIPILVHTLRAFEQVDDVRITIVAVPVEYIHYTKELAAQYTLNKVHVVAGGNLRQDSVQAGLAHVPPECDFVAVHDGARPLITPEIINACLTAAYKTGAAITAVPVKDTLKEVTEEKIIVRTVARKNLWQAQTPQVVRTDILKQAFTTASVSSFVGTDEASFLEFINFSMSIVEGSEQNIKITRPDDLLIAESILMQKKYNDKTSGSTFLRIGHGYDAHRLVSGRPLILGGIEIPHQRGLLGHSDADVLTHALCDALLGALGCGDIGKHFPDSDPAYKNISSLKLLEQVILTVAKQGYSLNNADITIIAQAPKLSPFFPAMRVKLAAVCGADINSINLKGTTTEKMGFPGREEGIAAHAVVLLHRQAC